MMLVWLSIGWVFASAAVACLPMRHQYVPGVALLLAAPVLIVMAGIQFGWIYAALGLAAFISMFRNPLRYIAARLRGEHPEIPE
jgi:ribose/xylose/arabinose/galactoside ABC-type transport system permease subunit